MLPRKAMSAAIPSRRKPARTRPASASARSPSGMMTTSGRSRAGASISIASRSIPAHQPRVAGPRHARGIEPRGHSGEEVRSIAGQMLVDAGGAGANCLVARVLAVEDAQGIALQPRLAVLGQLRLMPFEIGDQRRPPRLARVGVAEGVELERHALAYPQLLQQLVPEAQDFYIGLRLGGADDLGVELVELAEAALLRPLVAEGRAMGGELERRMLLPAFGEIGAADAGGELGPERDRIPAAVLERVHLLGDDVGGLADRAREYLRLLDGRHLDPLEPEQPAHAIERRDHRREAVGVFAEQALRAPHGLKRHHCAGLK